MRTAAVHSPVDGKEKLRDGSQSLRDRVDLETESLQRDGAENWDIFRLPEDHQSRASAAIVCKSCPSHVPGDCVPSARVNVRLSDGRIPIWEATSFGTTGNVAPVSTTSSRSRDRSSSWRLNIRTRTRKIPMPSRYERFKADTLTLSLRRRIKGPTIGPMPRFVRVPLSSRSRSSACRPSQP